MVGFVKKWKSRLILRGSVVVNNVVEKLGKVGEKVGNSEKWTIFLWFTQRFATDLRMDFNVDLHVISTFLNKLAINALLNFCDLVAKGEIEFKVGFDFFNAVHNGGVILDANFTRDFSST